MRRYGSPCALMEQQPAHRARPGKMILRFKGSRERQAMLCQIARECRQAGMRLTMYDMKGVRHAD